MPLREGRRQTRHEGTHQTQREAEGEVEGWARIVSDATSSMRCEVATRLATHASAFSGAGAECSRVL